MNSGAREAGNSSDRTTMRLLAGFLLSGFQLALPGAILPAWQHLGEYSFLHFGNYFLAFTAGVIASTQLSRWIMQRWGLTFLLVFSCSLSCGALAFLAVALPPLSPWLRIEGMAMLGIAAGLLNTGLFHGISAAYLRSPAVTVALGGVLFGAGSLLAAVLVATTFYVQTVSSMLLSMALVPAVFVVLYARNTQVSRPPLSSPSLRQAFRDFLSPGALLFALLLFFQFGNEWAIAGWLPLYVTRRLGVSPQSSLWLLALYWLSLLAGRMVAALLLSRIRHGRLLLGSVVAAMFGCLLLYFTNNYSGATAGVLLIGGSFAPIYPLVAERIGRRFEYYHPGLFNGIFSFALLGGMLAPASLGYYAYWLDDIKVVIWMLLFGSWMVGLLVLLIWLESKVTGR